MEFAKADLFSVEYRNVGNNLYRSGDLFLALIAYNKSICYANSKETLALAYANRAAVYLEQEMYEQCLENIQLARESYPKEKLEKLMEREEKCKKLMMENAGKTKDIPDKFFQLSYPPNGADSKLADCFEIRDKKFYAARDLNPGDIIYINEGSSKFLPQPGYVNQCYSCFKVNSMNLIPSLESAVFMYCSEECRKKPYVVDKSKVEAVSFQSFRQNHANKLNRNFLTFDPCPTYDEFDSNYTSNAHSPFTAHSDEPNVSYFHYDGIKEIFYVTRPVKTGELLTTGTWSKKTADAVLAQLSRTMGEVEEFACECFHCKMTLTPRQFINSPQFAKEIPKELLTAKELVEKLTENWNKIGGINNKKELRKMIEINEEYMELLAIKKTYLPEGRYCICRNCALKANDKIFDAVI